MRNKFGVIFLTISFFAMKNKAMAGNLEHLKSEDDISGDDFTCEYMKLGFHKYAEKPISDGNLQHFLRKADAPSDFKDSDVYINFMVRHKNKNITNGDLLWPNGRVPVELDFKTEIQKKSVWKLLQLINNETCVKIVPKTDEDEDYVHLQLQPKYMSSYIGHVGGKQEARLSAFTSFQVYHVFMHILGFVHQHQAPNRNKYVTVIHENIDKFYIKDYEILPDLTQSFGIPYDYLSATHYPEKYGSKFSSHAAILAEEPNIELRRPHTLSQGDIWKIQAMYNCPGILDFPATCN